jgi:hypothetical protein
MDKASDPLRLKYPIHSLDLILTMFPRYVISISNTIYRGGVYWNPAGTGMQRWYERAFVRSWEMPQLFYLRAAQ